MKINVIITFTVVQGQFFAILARLNMGRLLGVSVPVFIVSSLTVAGAAVYL